MKSIIYTVASSQTATAGTPLNVGGIVRRLGCAFGNTTNAIYVRKPGYYKITVDATVANGTGAAIAEELTIVQDGTAVSGGSVGSSVGANANVGLSNSVVIKVAAAGSSLQVTPTVTGATYSNLSLIAEEV